MGNAIREVVCSALNVPAGTPDDFNYRKSGAVDSLGLVRLILTLENVFRVMFKDEDVSAAEFNTVGGLVKMIETKLEAKNV